MVCPSQVYVSHAETEEEPEVDVFKDTYTESVAVSPLVVVVVIKFHPELETQIQLVVSAIIGAEKALIALTL